MITLGCGVLFATNKLTHKVNLQCKIHFAIFSLSKHNIISRNGLGHADMTNEDNLLEVTVQVLLAKACLSPEMYDMWGAMDHITRVSCWQISLDKAKNMVRHTMQWSIHGVFCPTLSRLFQTNNWMLCYRRMMCNHYDNTMFCLKVHLPKAIQWHRSLHFFG